MTQPLDISPEARTIAHSIHKHLHGCACQSCFGTATGVQEMFNHATAKATEPLREFACEKLGELAGRCKNCGGGGQDHDGEGWLNQECPDCAPIRQALADVAAFTPLSRASSWLQYCRSCGMLFNPAPQTGGETATSLPDSEQAKPSIFDVTGTGEIVCPLKLSPPAAPAPVGGEVCPNCGSSESHTVVGPVHGCLACRNLFVPSIDRITTPATPTGEAGTPKIRSDEDRMLGEIESLETRLHEKEMAYQSVLGKLGHFMGRAEELETCLGNVTAERNELASRLKSENAENVSFQCGYDDLKADLAATKERLAEVTGERDAIRVCFSEASHNAGPAFVAHEALDQARASLAEKEREVEKVTQERDRFAFAFIDFSHSIGRVRHKDRGHACAFRSCCDSIASKIHNHLKNGGITGLAFASANDQRATEALRNDLTTANQTIERIRGLVHGKVALLSLHELNTILDSAMSSQPEPPTK